MLEQDILECFQFGCTVNRACGIAGRTQNDGTCAWCDGLFQLLWSHLEILFDGGWDSHRSAFGQKHHLRITHPVGSRNDDLIALVDQSHNGITYALLGAIAAENLAGQIVQSILILEFCHNGLFQFWITRHRRVSGPVVLNSSNGSCLDMVRCIEVWFSHAHVDNIHSLSLEFTTTLAHGQSCARRQTIKSVRQNVLHHLIIYSYLIF